MFTWSTRNFRVSLKDDNPVPIRVYINKTVDFRLISTLFDERLAVS
jgi:hypothetical protein